MGDDARLEALEQRVTYLEREVDGEKSVTRHILRETRTNMDMLVLLASRMGKVEVRLENVDLRLDKVEGRLRSLETKFDGFPKVIADVMREVLAER